MIALDDFLIELSNTPGVSGYEAPVRRVLEGHWASLVDSLAVDPLGSLTATRQGNGPAPRKRLLIAAHMDQIGMMVTQIEGAFLRFAAVGGIDTRILLSQPVIVHGRSPLPGVIGARPPHVLSPAERNSYPPIEEMLIDCGLSVKDLEKQVRVGDVVSFASGAFKMGEEYIAGPAMDNRASVACVTRMLELLQGRQHEWDILISATVQEELGLRGAQVIAWSQAPDLAIAVDTTWGIGPGVSEEKGFKLGGGPSLVIGPNAHPGLFERVQTTARALDISITPEPMERSSGTDGWAIQVAREGVPTAILGLPIRNMHMPVEMVHLKDIERTARLLAEFACGLDDETLGTLAL